MPLHSTTCIRVMKNDLHKLTRFDSIGEHLYSFFHYSIPLYNGLMAFLRVYHPRDPKRSPLWQILDRHFEIFERIYEERFEKRYGFFRPVISEVVRSYLKCGDLKEGFARVRCSKCGHEYLLSFSCKVRCFCPSCQAKRVAILGHHLKENVFYPVPHRQYVFALPKMLRIYFQHDRSLLTGLCQCAYKSLITFLRERKEKSMTRLLGNS